MPPKAKKLSGTMSLKTRASIAGGAQTIGYYCFWKRVFEELELPLDTAFEHSSKICHLLVPVATLRGGKEC